MKTLQALNFRYAYEEFADHLKAMQTVRQWEYTARFGQLGEVQTSHANNARILEYFFDSYASMKEAIHKAEVFLSITDYLGLHALWFAKKGLMEVSGTIFRVEPALLRAVHYLFTTVDIPTHTAPRDVLALALAFKDIEAKQLERRAAPEQA